MQRTDWTDVAAQVADDIMDGLPESATARLLLALGDHGRPYVCVALADAVWGIVNTCGCVAAGDALRALADYMEDEDR